MKKKPTETMIYNNNDKIFKTILFGFVMLVCIGTFSCSKNETATPTPIVKVEEPKYLEWSYEAGKDPLLIQYFTFPTGLDRAKYFDISDTTKIQNIFEGSVSGTDRLGRQQTLDMTKNSWNAQIFPNVPVKVGGYEFSVEIRDELFKGLLITNVSGNTIIDWAIKNQNLTKIYNEKLKPQLDKKNEAYFKRYNKKPKYQVSVLVIPFDYYESGSGGTVMTMLDGNIVVLMIEPERSTGKLEQYLGQYSVLGHEFAGHGLNNYNLFKDYIGQKDQFGNTIDGSGHVNSPSPRFIFNGSISHHIRTDRGNTTLLFPQENKEYFSAYKEGFEPKNIEEDKFYYANLRLMKTPSEKSNIPYIADFVKNTRVESDKFMKEMWTDKVLKGGRTATNSEYVTIKSIISCQ
jgi:hypothetical protein